MGIFDSLQSGIRDLLRNGTELFQSPKERERLKIEKELEAAKERVRARTKLQLLGEKIAVESGKNVRIDPQPLLDAGIQTINPSSIMWRMLNGETKKHTEAVNVRNLRELNFALALNRAWEVKLRDFGDRNPRLAEYYEQRILPTLRDPKAFRGTTREAFSATIAQSMRHVDRHLETSGFFPQNEKRKNAFMQFKSLIWPNQVIAIMYSELLDTKNPKEAEAFFSFVLQHGGETFLQYFPALADQYVSVGPGQLTNLTVAKDGYLWKFQKNHLSRPLVPETMFEVRRNDHYEGTYMLTLDSLERLCRNLNDKQLDTLSRFAGKYPADTRNLLAQYVAAAHNNPKRALESMIEHIDAKIAKSRGSQGEKTELDIDQSRTAQNNADKARRNEGHLAKKRPEANMKLVK